MEKHDYPCWHEGLDCSTQHVWQYCCMAVESWVLTSDMENKINSFATSCYRVMLNIKRIDHVPNSRIYDDTNTEPLVNRVRLRQLKFLGHILRMPEEEPCRLYALYTPSHGRRKPGRQRTSYLSYIQKLLGDTNSMLHPKAIADLAQNRSDWRKFAIACCAADRWWWIIHNFNIICLF